jgi:hypothetical protein
VAKLVGHCCHCHVTDVTGASGGPKCIRHGGKKKHEKKHKITCRAMWGVKCKVFFSGIRLPLPLLPPDFGVRC